MIYLIGGTPRVGKTKLAQLITKEHGIPNISADALTHAIDDTYPQLELRKGEWETIPEKFYEFLRHLIGNLTWEYKDYIVEGDSFFPEHVARLQKEFSISGIFLGSSTTTLEDIKKYGSEKNWVTQLSEEKQNSLVESLIQKNEFFKQESAKYSIPYFDLTKDGNDRFAEVMKHISKDLSI